MDQVLNRFTLLPQRKSIFFLGARHVILFYKLRRVTEKQKQKRNRKKKIVLNS